MPEQPTTTAATYSKPDEYVRKSIHAGSSFYGELTNKDARRGVDAIADWLSSHPVRPPVCYHSVYDDDCAGCGYHRAITLLREPE